MRMFGMYVSKDALCHQLVQVLNEGKHGFVSNASDMVVCHCDQVPMWLMIGSMRQLVSATELSGAKTKGDGARGGQQCKSVLDDGMSQIRQACNSEADRFRVTLELSQYVHNVFRPGTMPVVEHGDACLSGVWGTLPLVQHQP